MWIAIAQGLIQAACLPVISPGGTALLMASTAGTSRPVASAIASCVAAAAGAVASSGTRLAQLLLEPSELKTAEALRSEGFENLAVLLYLQRTLTRDVPAPPSAPDFAMIHYSEQTHPLFARAILATYEDSLDCPRLHGLRSIEEVIAGHKASGAFDPNLWFCVVPAGAGTEHVDPLGVLILSPVPGHPTMELVYIGLAPAARGRRLGDLLLQIALHQTQQAGLQQLTLAVDQGNAPALRLYYRHGLGEIHRRIAMLKIP
jgi:ribosomal protein S18 acetylase RimI-like enzyme